MSFNWQPEKYIEPAHEVLDAIPAEHIFAVSPTNSWVLPVDELTPGEVGSAFNFLIKNSPDRPKTLLEFSTEFAGFADEKKDEQDILRFKDALKGAIILQQSSRKMVGGINNVNDVFDAIAVRENENPNFPNDWTEDER